MTNQDQIDMMMRDFPPEAELLQMSAEDVGIHLIKHMTRGRAETNKFDFLQMVPGGQVAFRFMATPCKFKWSEHFPFARQNIAARFWRLAKLSYSSP